MTSEQYKEDLQALEIYFKDTISEIREEYKETDSIYAINSLVEKALIQAHQDALVAFKNALHLYYERESRIERGYSKIFLSIRKIFRKKMLLLLQEDDPKKITLEASTLTKEKYSYFLEVIRRRDRDFEKELNLYNSVVRDIYCKLNTSSTHLKIITMEPVTYQ